MQGPEGDRGRGIQLSPEKRPYRQESISDPAQFIDAPPATRHDARPAPAEHLAGPDHRSLTTDHCFPPPQRTNPAKNTTKTARTTTPNFDPLHLRANHSQMCENYSDLFPRNAKITATNHYRFAQFLARTLKESRNSERTFQRFRATPASLSATKNVILSEPLIR
jgi:hypothetical protein